MNRTPSATFRRPVASKWSSQSNSSQDRQSSQSALQSDPLEWTPASEATPCLLRDAADAPRLPTENRQPNKNGQKEKKKITVR